MHFDENLQITKLVADFNCNYINPVDLGNVIYTLVLNYLPNSLVTIERNGVGTGTLAQLMKSKIRNLIYRFVLQDYVQIFVRFLIHLV